MINLSLNFLQILVLIILVVAVWAIMQRVVQILIKIIFSSKPVVSWNAKRQTEQHRVIIKQRQLISIENLTLLGRVLDEIDKSLPNNGQKKQFYRDFATSKQTREYWIKTLIDMNSPKPIASQENKNEEGK